MKWFSENITMKYFIFISLLTLAHCRPQDTNPKQVEIEKQILIKLPNTNEQSRQLPSDEEKIREASTKDILEKIAQVNLNHGLTPKTIKRPPFYSAHIPHQLNQEKQDQQKESKGKQLPNFQFSNTPLGNPIFEYLQRNPNKHMTKQSSYSADNTNDEEEIPEGYAIKRKVTHQQTLIIPNYPQMPDQYYNPMFASLPTQNQFDPTKGGQYGLIPVNQFNPNNLESEEAKPKNNTNENKTLDELTAAKQNFLINNIKNIVSNSQVAPGYYPNQYNPYNPYQAQINPYMNPYQYNADPYGNFRVNPVINPYNPYNTLQNYIPVAPQIPLQNQNQKFTDTYYANLQAAKDSDSAKFLGPEQNLPNSEASSRQFSGPFSQYFPIVIKNPFQQMFQAFTSMIEYGPESNLCRKHAEDKHNPEVEVEEAAHRSQSRAGKSLDAHYTDKPSIDLKDDDTKTEIVIQKLEESTETSDNDFYIEGLKIISDKKSTKPKKSTIKKSEQLPEVRQMEEESEPESPMLLEEDKLFNIQRYPPKDEFASPGNGIFIQKLKVRKGGVAIAGPGGIATAGSGGTAIVGPNGFAYTQPNGVAIAGPGSRVISVDPSVNLSEFVQNMMKNKTLARFGKVVAVGPVVYHDLGQN